MYFFIYIFASCELLIMLIKKPHLKSVKTIQHNNKIQIRHTLIDSQQPVYNHYIKV